MLCNGYMWNKIISKLFRPSSTSIQNNFISARGNLPEIISKLFHRLIADHEYFQHVQCHWNNFEIISELFQRVLKLFQNYVSDIEHVGKYSAFSGWNNFRTLLMTEIILQLFQYFLSHVKHLNKTVKHLNNFKIISISIISKLFQSNFISHVTMV